MTKERLYPWQVKTIEYCYNNVRKSPKTLVAAPTGCGKSYVELELQDALDDCWIITPRIEIIRGMIKKLGFNAEHYDEEQILSRAFEHKISTPIRLKNKILNGKINSLKYLIWDEVHHHQAESYQLIDSMTGVPSIGFTATPYRGTAKSTQKFREQWGPPYQAISYQEAVKLKYINFPFCRIEALVDDDLIQIQNGEFEISSLESEIKTRMDDAIKLFKEFCDPHTNATCRLDIPTMVALPTRRLCLQLGEKLSELNIPFMIVTQETDDELRQLAFKRCIDCAIFLIQIDVVSEGVDLPIRRLIDMRPTMSPVRWLQQIGRIMRPGDVYPEYICTNRNLLRHGYLLEGLIPASKFVEAQYAFPNHTTRYLGYRAIGLEALGRFKPTSVRMANGLDCILYNIAVSNGNLFTQFMVIIHPMIPTPLVAKKESTSNETTNEMRWGRWVEAQVPDDFKGFASAIPKILSTKQSDWWKKSARTYGLDDSVNPDAKQFQILPVLTDLRKKVS